MSVSHLSYYKGYLYCGNMFLRRVKRGYPPLGESHSLRASSFGGGGWGYHERACPAREPNSLQYIDVIELACSVRTGKIFVEFLFFASLWTEPQARSINLQKKTS